MFAIRHCLAALVCFLGIGRAQSCYPDEFLCADGNQCSPNRFRCNNLSGGCWDGSDEGEHCRNFTCPAGKQKCNDDLVCFGETQICDGGVQCGDDENNCEDYVCLPGWRKCADNLQCIHELQYCDYAWYNCYDNSDEGSHCANPPVVCVSVAIDVSESLDDPSHLLQETLFLDKLWTRFNDRFNVYRFIMNLIPFNDKVVASDVVRIASAGYSKKDAFLAGEQQAFNGIKNQIKNKDTRGTTDFGALVDYVTNQTCSGDLSVLFFISDYIFTKGRAIVPATVKIAVKELTDKGYKVVAVALDKARLEYNFEEVGKGHKIDVAKSDYPTTLNEVVTDLLKDL